MQLVSFGVTLRFRYSSIYTYCYLDDFTVHYLVFHLAEPGLNQATFASVSSSLEPRCLTSHLGAGV